ncbi:MAG TPA: acyl-CoA dehydrogenase family protein, partial [Kofleriaceae bacterium]|nr:acyl-CoA dehydrogenase family protein [Kofleriaceae bacterium]
RLVSAAAPIADAAAADPSGTRVAREMGERHGLYELLLPADGTADVRALCLARELLGYASPLADAIFAVQGLGSYPVLVAGSDEQRHALLDRFRSGALIGGFALTEPEAGSDVASIATTARRDGDGWVLDGDKTLISNVGIAGSYVLFANADPSAGRKGITAFLVPSDAPGLTETAIALGVDHPIGGLVLRGCRVAADAVLGEVGGGFKLAMQTLDTFRVTVGAAAVGMARRALDESVARVRARVQFGKPLAEQQIVQSYLAEMATELDAARLLVLRAAHAKDGGRERVTTEAAMAKLYATEAAQRIIDTAVQLHGGLGVTSGTAVENLYRSIRPLRIYEGTSEIQRLIIGRAITKEHA